MTDTREYTTGADAAIELDSEGRGTVTINGTPYPLTGPDLSASRRHAKARVVEYARETGETVAMRVTEQGSTMHLVVTPDGRILDTPRGHSQTPAQVPTAPVPTAPAERSPAPRDPELEEEEKRPATEGARGALNRLGFHLPPGSAEMEERRRRYEERREAERAQREQESRSEARRRRREEAERSERALIQTNFMGTRTILIANPKGGARKTTSCYVLAATMGTIRGGSVVAWDANETMGTLGDRSREDRHNHTVVDLLEQAAPEFTSVEGSRLGVLDSYVRTQGDSHFDVLASDEDPTRQDIVGAEKFGTIHEILSRFYRIILVDTGNNIRAAHFQAALESTDQLVIPVAASRDSARVARKMMEAFSTSGHRRLVDSAVVLLHDLEPADAASGDYLEVAQSIAAEFEPLVSAVVPVPFDAHLKDGARIDYAALSDPTRTAYRQAAAAIAESLSRPASNTADAIRGEQA